MLIRIIRVLILHDFFNHHNSQTVFDLEFHLRSIVASLRLLSFHGIQAGSGSLNVDILNQLYNRMAWWNDYFLKQVENSKSEIKNYNTEFLIVYARDLIVSLPSDRTFAANAGSRIIAAAAMLGHAVVSIRWLF